ncbi:MAG TPA: crosslink repair DNA glycosylase YcaQ family protein, partial [Ilumatobacteraceae bacterium]|nr:crosslink repair DNA glycosylase YcaQ family protein [Ilumatobacteraceae bacterium]
MTSVHHLSRTDARRIAVRAQLLDSTRPTDLMTVIRHLTMLQLDPISAVAPSADLVLWGRLGSAYSPSELRTALDEHRVIELRAMLRPADDMALYRAEMAQWPGVGEIREYKHTQAMWVADNDACRRDILDRLRSEGPLSSRDLPDTCVRPWASTGWNNDKNVTMLLGFMVQRGEITVAGRKGRDRLWDLADRVYPNTPPVAAAEAERTRNARRLAALGIARARGPECPVEPADVGEAGEPAVIDGVRGEWRVDPAQLGQPFKGRAALLSPFDRLIHERTRTLDLFGFDYALEMYKPASKRKWGYYALPILYGDQLVGKLDATADRKTGVLRVDALHQDVSFTKTMTSAVDREIADLAKWLNLE